MNDDKMNQMRNVQGLFVRTKISNYAHKNISTEFCF